jgi:hypothetical protein
MRAFRPVSQPRFVVPDSAGSGGAAAAGGEAYARDGAAQSKSPPDAGMLAEGVGFMACS